MSEATTEELHTIALIREALGVGHKPMLSELPDICKAMREVVDQAAVSNGIPPTSGVGKYAHDALQVRLHLLNALIAGGEPNPKEAT